MQILTRLTFFLSYGRMAPTGNALIVQRAVLILLFRVVRLLFNCVQTAVWHLTGTAQKAADAKKPEH